MTTNAEYKKYLQERKNRTEPDCWNCCHKWKCEEGCVWRGWDSKMCDKFYGFYIDERMTMKEFFLRLKLIRSLGIKGAFDKNFIQFH